MLARLLIVGFVLTLGGCVSTRTAVAPAAMPPKVRVIKNGAEIVMDYEYQRWQDLVLAGNYGDSHRFQVSDFAIGGRGGATYFVVALSPSARVSSTDAILCMDGLGMRPGKLEHLLALGAAVPDFGKEHDVVALGSVCDKDTGSYVPVISAASGSRKLEKHRYDRDWEAQTMFLAYREIPSSGPE